MITAKEAAMRSKCHGDFIREMNHIERAVCKAMMEGKYTASHCPPGNYDEDLLTVIKNELESLGYKIEYVPAKPLPAGCPVDQWDFSSYLHISWEVK
jgi:hypothetical protein